MTEAYDLSQKVRPLLRRRLEIEAEDSNKGIIMVFGFAKVFDPLYAGF